MYLIRTFTEYKYTNLVAISLNCLSIIGHLVIFIQFNSCLMKGHHIMKCIKPTNGG